MIEISAKRAQDLFQSCWRFVWTVLAIFRPCSNFFSTVLEICLDRARDILIVLEFCFDRFWTIFENCFNRSSMKNLTALETHFVSVRGIFERARDNSPCSKQSFSNFLINYFFKK